MSKTLRTIQPFFVMEVGDTFILADDGKSYISQHDEDFRKAGEDTDVHSSYHSTFSISPEYAKQLIEEGYLEEVGDKKEKSSFVNVFDEIDNLISKYKNDLDNIDLDMAGEPQCVKVEKTTVLTNILSVLNHLKNLRK